MDILRNFFIPPCFQPDNAQDTNLTKCLWGEGGRPDPNGAIPFWTQKLFIVVAIVAFFYVVYGGFMMITAFGNEARFTEAKRTVLYALIGMVIATLAAVIVGAIVQFLSGSFTP